ncbi:N-acetylglucosamine kinase [Nitriliruptor alkaliphilus]|uniref:N-acetylglucosamine kinase n=1 Tax=Nitriliruptor alkaliphilus TaxID=427918 RepID=UPI00069621E2|nr:BadF/BadG/BcrA/BcrD ATPase family protein [Nitriliruptor alkaliphilus]
MSPPRILAIDGGKTGCRAASFGPEGRGPTSTGPGIENVVAPGALALIRSALEVSIGDLARQTPFDVVCLGLTGVLQPGGHAAAVTSLLEDMRLARRVIVTSDSVTTFCGALGLRPGVVVAAGTGTIGLAVGEDGRLARVDGWGYLLDDAGSAFDIGRAGLREALRASDGRRGSAALRAAAQETFGDADGILAAVYGATNPARVVAGFAREVTAAALAGDETATRLLRDAGRALAETCAAAASRVLDLSRPVPVSWQGGVFRAGDLVIEPFREALIGALPTAVPAPPRGDALDGAAALASTPDSTVFDALLERGGRVAS